MLFRLYLDESGDHTYPSIPDPEVGTRYLALVGVWFPREGPAYDRFATALEMLKRDHLRFDPDAPPVLHRKEIMYASGAFWPLRDDARRRAFDAGLLALVNEHVFTVVGVVIDKVAHRAQYGIGAFHPYYYCLDMVLERYCGFLRHRGHTGDVMAESRGGTFDRELKHAYQETYRAGTYGGYFRSDVIQQTLTSREIKLKTKQANVPGLQLADVLANAVKLDVLTEYGRVEPPKGFDGELC